MSNSETASANRPPTREEVIAAYRLLLGRKPENESAVISHLAMPTLAKMVAGICASEEFRDYMGHGRTKPGQDVFFNYHSNIDVERIIHRNIDHARKPMADHLVNFLGVAMHTSFMPHIAERGGQLDEIPIPANHHADMAEWGAALRSVELADGTYSMIELGCGWGCWMNNMGIAAKRKGLNIHVVGIEGDVGHIEFAKQALATNGILPSEYTLIRGIAAASGGSALFPRQASAGLSWGLEPIFNATKIQIEDATNSGNFDLLPMVPLSRAIGDRKIVNLLHLDIQGGEADLVRDCLQLLNERVAYMVIGTHSREIEGRLFSELLSAGWVLEVERPAILEISRHGHRTKVDGVQGWRNPVLCAAQT